MGGASGNARQLPSLSLRTLNGGNGSAVKIAGAKRMLEAADGGILN
jgi:hypothetical protein